MKLISHDTGFVYVVYYIQIQINKLFDLSETRSALINYNLGNTTKRGLQGNFGVETHV